MSPRKSSPDPKKAKAAKPAKPAKAAAPAKPARAKPAASSSASRSIATRKIAAPMVKSGIYEYLLLVAFSAMLVGCLFLVIKLNGYGFDVKAAGV